MTNNHISFSYAAAILIFFGIFLGRLVQDVPYPLLDKKCTPKYSDSALSCPTTHSRPSLIQNALVIHNYENDDVD